MHRKGYTTRDQPVLLWPGVASASGSGAGLAAGLCVDLPRRESRAQSLSTFSAGTPLKAMGKTSYCTEHHEENFFSSSPLHAGRGRGRAVGAPRLRPGASPLDEGGGKEIVSPAHRRGTRINGRVLIWHGRWVMSGDG
jgi:hypothetical protein